jgi:hypothetical protein
MDQISQLYPMNFTQTRFPQFAVALIAVGALAGYATFSEVREIRPFFLPIPVGTAVLVKAEGEIEKGLRQDRNEPVAALDEYLADAKTAEDQIHRDPREFLQISDTSAAPIPEYLGEGAPDPNLDNENGTTHRPFLNQSIWTCQSPTKFPAI